MIIESEGFREAAQNEGEALARQVEFIAQSLSGGAAPSEEVKLKALDTLVDLRRLEQLKAIAHGQSNSTYFFGESAKVGREPYDVENTERWKRLLEAQRKRLPAVTSESSPVHVNVGSEPTAPV